MVLSVVRSKTCVITKCNCAFTIMDVVEKGCDILCLIQDKCIYMHAFIFLRIEQF